MTSETRETVFLVDGSSYIHRAYHAIPKLTNSKGFPTNATLGFTRMLLKLMAEAGPAYLGVALDAGGETFRHVLYPAYKANRPPMPDDLRLQVPVIKSIIADLGLCQVERPGYEADDILGTLARLCAEQGFDVVVITGDKDFRQILTPHISLWDTMKDVRVSYESLREAYSLLPGQFVDVMALSGDTSDNIPGIPGVGEKTAVRLIREYGSLEGLGASLAGIPQARLRENLERHWEKALLSRELVRIDCRLPLEGLVGELRVGEPQRVRLAALFREQEFHGLWEQFGPRSETSADYRLITRGDELSRVVADIRAAGAFAIDTETTDLDPLKGELVGVSLAWIEGAGVYLPLGHAYLGVPPQLDKGVALEAVRTLLEDRRLVKVGQNIKYDAEVLTRYGLRYEGPCFDTMVASYVINPGLRQHNLDFLAQHFLGYRKLAFEAVAGKGKQARPFSAVPLETAMPYACEDADIALRLWRLLERGLRADGNEALFYDLEMRLIPVLVEMELTGIRIDKAYLEGLADGLARELVAIEQEIYAAAGMPFNLNSPQQLGYVLFEKLGLPTQKKTAKTRAFSTDVRTLTKLSAYPHPVPRLVLRYRSLSKLKATYLDALVGLVHPGTGRIHTSFNQTVTATGRLSSSNPNLQNIPVRSEEGRAIRRGFVASPGHYLVAADYSQMELRILAHYSGDAAFLEAFRNREDIHVRTASEMLGVGLSDVTAGMRRVAKVINFGIIYGMGAQKLAEQLETDLKTARNYIAAYLHRYQGVARYREEMIQLARRQGYVTTLLNRRRYLPDIQHANRVIRAEAERMAINTPIQGTAADLIKVAMIRIHDQVQKAGLETRMVLQVHDELVFEVPAGELDTVAPMIKVAMEDVYPLEVPLLVDMHTGVNWDEAH